MDEGLELPNVGDYLEITHSDIDGFLLRDTVTQVRPYPEGYGEEGGTVIYLACGLGIAVGELSEGTPTILSGIEWKVISYVAGT